MWLIADMQELTVLWDVISQCILRKDTDQSATFTEIDSFYVTFNSVSFLNKFDLMIYLF